MHAGVFGARISEEAFQTLLHLTEINFAALNIPEENNQPYNNSGAIISRKISKIKLQKSIKYQDNFNVRVSRLIENPQGEKIRGVFEIVFPILRNPSQQHRIVVMSNHAKSLEDSHEPMEIEEISYTETPSEVFKPLIIKIEKDLESPADIKPKKILRESKLTKVLKEQKTRAQDPNDDKKTAITSDCSEPQKPTSTDSDNIQKTKPKLPVKEPAEIRPMEEHSWKIIFFILFPVVILVACVSIAREEFGSEICAHRFDPTNAIKDLENRVYGQRKAMRELRSHLTTVSSGLTLLVLTGGTGVGKSYAAHLISENFPSKKNVFQYVQPLKKKLRYASNAISVCGCNLIIVENLNNRDIAEAADFVEYIAGKIDDVNYCVIIIEVINVQVTDENLKREVNLAKSKAEIENIYRDKKLDVKIVQFEHLEDEAVTKCIIDAANSSNLTLSQSEIDDVRISLKISDSGCKGARAKVHLLDKKIGFI